MQAVEEQFETLACAARCGTTLQQKIFERAQTGRVAFVAVAQYPEASVEQLQVLLSLPICVGPTLPGAWTRRGGTGTHAHTNASAARAHRAQAARHLPSWRGRQQRARGTLV